MTLSLLERHSVHPWSRSEVLISHKSSVFLTTKDQAFLGMKKRKMKCHRGTGNSLTLCGFWKMTTIQGKEFILAIPAVNGRNNEGHVKFTKER